MEIWKFWKRISVDKIQCCGGGDSPSGQQNKATHWTGGASDIVTAKSSGEDPRATGGLVSNLPHPRVNKTKQHSILPHPRVNKTKQHTLKKWSIGECLRAGRFQATLFLHTTCIRSCCILNVSCVAAKLQKKQKLNNLCFGWQILSTRRVG